MLIESGVFVHNKRIMSCLEVWIYETALVSEHFTTVLHSRYTVQLYSTLLRCVFKYKLTFNLNLQIFVTSHFLTVTDTKFPYTVAYFRLLNGYIK